MKTDLFQSCGHRWIFQICWHIECSTFTASSFSIWNSSTGIPSPALALFVVMLRKAQLTSHSRMSGSRWVITPSWLSGSWSYLLYSSSVYSWYLFLIFSASVRSLPFLSFIEPIFAWNVPLVSLIFLKRSLSFPFYCFPLFLCIDHWGRLSYLVYSHVGQSFSRTFSSWKTKTLHLLGNNSSFPHPTRPWQPWFYFLFLWIWPFQVPCISAIIQNLFFCDWHIYLA